jgi:hypothetical protein
MISLLIRKVNCCINLKMAETGRFKNHFYNDVAISNNLLTVFQFLVVAVTLSLFSKNLLDNFVSPYPPGVYKNTSSPATENRSGG